MAQPQPPTPSKDRRVELDDILRELIPNGWHIYFQPAQNVSGQGPKLEYPAIVYSRDMARTQYADNSPWRHTKRYQVMVIDRNPDSEVPDKVAKLPTAIFNRHYTADGLHHDVYNLYF